MPQQDNAVVQDILHRVHPGWHLPPIEPTLRSCLAERHQGIEVLPQPGNILRALSMPPEEVRVLIIGQDPYPTPGHAVGLAFSADLPHGVSLPASLKNIFIEYADDLGLPYPTSGDLSPWIRQGVLLLNRVLTVRAARPASHQGRGWEAITHAAIKQVAAYPTTVAILWGRLAQQVAPLFGSARCVASPHPSPLSAHRGFFGSRPFTRANALRQALGADPVDWRLSR